MAHAAAYSIFALTVGLALARPRVGRIRIQPALAALLGACLCLLLGLVTWRGVAATFRILALPVVTIASLMVITAIADQAGLFRLLAWRVARAAAGDGRRLFGYLFFTGTLTGALFTNDAAVLIFTPMVYRLVEEVKEDHWTLANKIPFYFAVLYVANLVAPLVIGNPINIVVAGWFGIGFLEYAQWMILPALASIVVSFLGLRWFFRRSIPATYRVPAPRRAGAASRRFLALCALVLAATLAGFCAEQWTGVPGGVVAAGGAAFLLAFYLSRGQGSLGAVARGVGWDVLLFVACIFLVARALSNAGLAAALGGVLGDAAPPDSSYTTALVAGGCSAFMNNHPVAGLMAVVIRDLSVSPLSERMLAFSALIGGDLGPKMLPIGSLAALMWYRILRQRGVHVSYGTYIRLGVPVTLAAILASVAVLNLQYALVTP